MRYVFDETFEIRMKIQSWVETNCITGSLFIKDLHWSFLWCCTFHQTISQHSTLPSLSLSLQCKKHTNNLKHFLYQSNLFHNISSSALIQGYLTALSRSSLKFDSPSMFQINRTNSLFQDLTMSEMLVAHTYVCSSSVLHTGSNRINQTKHIIYAFIVFSPFDFVATCTLKL